MRQETGLASEVVLEAAGITKSFPGVRALDGVDLVVRRRRLNALLGENGAGKSTLMNVLAGALSPDKGTIRIDGRPVRFANTREAQAAGVSIIFQELNLVPGLSIAENIFIGREPVTRLGLVDYGRMNRAAGELLRELDLDVDPATRVSELRLGARQVVEIAKAISFDCRVLIMDEPTSAISRHEVEVLFRQIARLKQKGVGIVYITHKLDELPAIADDVTVLRDGKLVGTREFGSVTRDQMIAMMVGRELSDLFHRERRGEPGNVVLRVKNVSLRAVGRGVAVDDVSFEVRRGEVLGIFGLMGAGRTELFHAIFGTMPGKCSGEIEVDGTAVRIDSPQDAMAAGLALAPEDRKGEGVVMGMSVAQNVTLSSLPKVERLGFLSRRLEQTLVDDYMSRLRIKTPSRQQAVGNLSGGNQQKVVLAKWLATGPKVLLLDEPTRGVDVHAKKEIYAMIDDLARGGLAVVMVSSELPEILGVADRIVVLCEGRKTADFMRAEATEEKIVRAALPGGKG